MAAVSEYWDSLARGFCVTLWVGLHAILGAALGSLILGPLRLSKTRAIRVTSMVFIELIRGPSALILLFWVFYVLPLIPGMPQLSPLAAAILVLAVDGAAYGAEIVRAGIESVHRDQSDACHALGLSNLQTLRKVVLPQALSQIVPAFGSMARDMFKWTSIVSFVGVPDVLYVANNVRSQTFEAAIVFCLVAAIYWILCLLCAGVFRAIEQVLPLNQALRASRTSAQVVSNAKAVAGAAQ
ncbi:amino acid ABC transporter permease [Bradyrhizobium sp. 153]|uniref:amino acid ABC transporter permease n=1 Tax=Bradyrhizobium sp. 153 TaxID=2782627 RepID=UPI001FF86F41|nr:amino acid ABC transporter permease [Bradyrhizobium sp. 153]